mmetsp:Transcript_123918/g.264187  ORF Transcript_123918/g.264187 Transcript_123918/m.264187 type:complete len:743 (-) Transcript_123918:260-2488(-)
MESSKPGRRRGPQSREWRQLFQKQVFKTKMCRFFPLGQCRYSNDCPYAHDFSELQVLPNLAKTSLCTEWQKGSCKRGDKCQYAHGSNELRKSPVFEATKKDANEVLDEQKPVSDNGQDEHVNSNGPEKIAEMMTVTSNSNPTARAYVCSSLTKEDPFGQEGGACASQAPQAAGRVVNPHLMRFEAPVAAVAGLPLAPSPAPGISPKEHAFAAEAFAAGVAAGKASCQNARDPASLPAGRMTADPRDISGLLEQLRCSNSNLEFNDPVKQYHALAQAQVEDGDAPPTEHIPSGWACSFPGRSLASAFEAPEDTEAVLPPRLRGHRSEAQRSGDAPCPESPERADLEYLWARTRSATASPERPYRVRKAAANLVVNQNPPMSPQRESHREPQRLPVHFQQGAARNQVNTGIDEEGPVFLTRTSEGLLRVPSQASSPERGPLGWARTPSSVGTPMEVESPRRRMGHAGPWAPTGSERLKADRSTKERPAGQQPDLMDQGEVVARLATLLSKVNTTPETIGSESVSQGTVMSAMATLQQMLVTEESAVSHQEGEVSSVSSPAATEQLAAEPHRGRASPVRRTQAARPVAGYDRSSPVNCGRARFAVASPERASPWAQQAKQAAYSAGDTWWKDAHTDATPSTIDISPSPNSGLDHFLELSPQSNQQHDPVYISPSTIGSEVPEPTFLQPSPERTPVGGWDHTPSPERTHGWARTPSSQGSPSGSPTRRKLHQPDLHRLQDIFCKQI